MTDRTPCCPTCGRGLDDYLYGISVDLSSNTVLTPRGGVQLTPTQAEIAYLLKNNMPSFVNDDRIYAGVWGNPEKARHATTIHVYIYHMRRLLKPIGIEIESRTGCGYQMKAAWEKEKAA